MLQESLGTEAENQISQRDLARAEAALLLDEIMAVCDRLTREVAFRRIEGLSWNESANAMEFRATRQRRDLAKLLTAPEKG